MTAATISDGERWMGYDDGFDEFAAAAWPRLLRSAYLLSGDHHVAEDLTQAALARTFASWRRVRRADALAYTRKVLINLNLDRVRRRRVLEVGGEGLPQVASAHDHGTEDRDEIVRLLRGLTERERRVVVLRHYFDLSEADVAAELGIARGTVKSALARALRKLRVDAETPSTFETVPATTQMEQ